jgi:hypothetical protein
VEVLVTVVVLPDTLAEATPAGAVELMVVVDTEALSWGPYWPTTPQPARREVATATSSKLAKAALNLFKLATTG